MSHCGDAGLVICEGRKNGPLFSMRRGHHQMPAHKRERGCVAGLRGRGLPKSKRPEQCPTLRAQHSRNKYTLQRICIAPKHLSTRMASRRFTRLTIGFSKKLQNHCAAVALWISFYNFCRVHESLRCTPAMALGVTDHTWSVGELINAANESSDVPPIPRKVQSTQLPGARRFRLTVGRGGKGTNQLR